MRTRTIITAALFAAVLMAIPLVLSPDGSSAEPTTEKTDYAPGEILKLDRDIVLDDLTVVMEPGSAVAMCVTQGFSIGTTSGTGGLTLCNGSEIYILNTFEGIESMADLELHPEAVVDSLTVGYDLSVFMRGKIAYNASVTLMGIDAGLTISAGTVISNDSDIDDALFKIGFPTDNSVTMSCYFFYDSSGNIGINGGTLNLAIDVQPSLTYSGVTVPIILRGSGTYGFDASVPIKTGTMTASMTGGASCTLSFLGLYSATLGNETDARLTIEGYGTEDPARAIEGRTKFTLGFGDLNIDWKGTSYKLKDLETYAELRFLKDGFGLGLGTVLGECSATPYNGTASYVRDLKAEMTYEAAADISLIVSPAPSEPFSLEKLLEILGLDSESGTMSEYLEGVAEGTKDKSIQEYASRFFLERFDGVLGLKEKGITSKAVGVDVSVGEASLRGDRNIDLLGFKASAHINPDEGVSIRASTDKLVSKITVLETMKMMAEPFDISLNTYDGTEREKYVFRTALDLTGELKVYSNGALTSDPYTRGLHMNVDIGPWIADISDFGADTIAMNSHGIDMTVRNPLYDAVNGTFRADIMDIEGKYSGGSGTSLLREVDGSCKDVTFGFGLGLNGLRFRDVVSQSADITFTDVFGSELRMFTYYDAEKNKIVHECTAEGQFWLIDELNDDSVSGYFDPAVRAPEDASGSYVFEGVILLEDTDVPEGANNLVINGHEFRIYFSDDLVMEGTMTGTLYVPCTSLGHTEDPLRIDYVNRFTVNGTTYTLDRLTGAALGITVNEDGSVAYSIVELPGYTLTEDSVTKGFVMGDIDDGRADVTIKDTVLSYGASPDIYDIYIDGEKVTKDGVVYGQTFNLSRDELEKIAPDVIMLVDRYGKVFGEFADGAWSCRYVYACDLDLKSVSAEHVKKVSTTKTNVTDASAITFTVPEISDEDSIVFRMGSGVVFTISGSSLQAGSGVELVAEEVRYRGEQAYLIDARSDDGILPTVVRIPVSEGNMKLMHVDQYGRASELDSNVVTVNGELFLETSADSYSVFYVTEDIPRYVILPTEKDLQAYVVTGVVIAVLVVLIGCAVIRRPDAA